MSRFVIEHEGDGWIVTFMGQHIGSCATEREANALIASLNRYKAALDYLTER